jgi:hypothetical protein
MQSIPQPSPGATSRGERATMSLERLVFCQALCLVARRVYRKCTVLLNDRRKHKWIWGILLALASYESYFVRAQLAALFFFTILYVILAALITLYILMVDAVYNAFLWTASIRRPFHLLLQHHAASPARVPGLSEGRQSARACKCNASPN